MEIYVRGIGRIVNNPVNSKNNGGNEYELESARKTVIGE